MDKDVKMRVKIAMESLGISAYSIAKSCSINERTIYEQTNGSSRIGVSAVAALLSVSPELSAEWLLRGTGEMLISSVVPTEGQPREHRENTETTTATTRQRHGNEPMGNATLTAALEQIEQLQTELAQQKEFNALQREYVADLKERIAEYQERISELKEIIHELKKAQHAATVPHAKNA